jgi:uncharacterized protein
MRQEAILHFFYLDKKKYSFNSDSLEVALTDKCIQKSNIESGQHKKLPLTSQNKTAKGHHRVEVLVNATQKCNLKCSYCFVDKGRFSFTSERCESLSSQTIRKLLEELPKRIPSADNFCIHFYGGEPLLNLDAIEEAIDVAMQNEGTFSFAITTNGTISNKKAINSLKRGNFNVVLSIDGPDYIHNEHRKTKHGDPTHTRVLEFLKKAKAAGLHVRGSSVVRKGWSLREARAYLDTLPIDAVKAQAVRLPAHNPLSLDASERADYFNQLKQIGQETIDSIRNGKVPKDDRFNIRLLLILCKVRRNSFCGAGFKAFGMSSDGTMLPCVLLAGKEEAVLGNINDGGEWAKRGIEWAEKHKPRSNCHECWALPLCGGGCPSMLSVCGEDECELVRMNCEIALQIYAAFLDHPQDLLVLSEVLENSD